MAIFNFNAPRPRQFNYKPRYYDERKERLNNMIAAAKAEKEGKQDPNAAKNHLQPGFLREYRRLSKRGESKLKRASAIRVMMYMAVLAMLFYVYTGNQMILYITFGVMFFISLGAFAHRS